MINVEINNQQTRHPIDAARLRTAVARVLEGESFIEGTVSVAIVDDPAIRRLNQQYLGHDCATDVLSFVLERGQGWLEGEIIASAEMAAASAGRFGWSAADELHLYITHGALHLTGYDDQTAEAARTMRSRERHYLSPFGLDPRYDEPAEVRSPSAQAAVGQGQAAP